MGLLVYQVEKPDPPPLGHYGVVVQGWEAGHLTCGRAIRENKKTPDPSAVP